MMGKVKWKEVEGHGDDDDDGESRGLRGERGTRLMTGSRFHFCLFRPSICLLVFPVIV